MSELAQRIALLAAALSPKSAASALEGLPDKLRAPALARLKHARAMNRLQWRRELASVLTPSRSRREAVLASAGPKLREVLRERLAAPRAEGQAETARERVLRRLVRECGG